MKRVNWIVVFILIFYSCTNSHVDLLSPNGNLKVTLELPDKEVYGEVAFSVDFAGKRILSNTKLGLVTDLRTLSGNLKLKSISEIQRIKDDYYMITGKRSHCTNEALERTYCFENEKGQQLEVIFRVYNDGIAFKYALYPLCEKETVKEEHTAYHISKGIKRWIQSYDVSYERFFPLAKEGLLIDEPKVTLWGYPALVEPQDSVFMLITEANIQREHCCSMLYNGRDRESYQVCLADQPLVCQDIWHSPWRLLIIGSLADIVESTLVTDVSEPSKIKNNQWIMPGMVSWVYWAHNNGSRDFKILKDYVDLAAHMKWPYDLIDAEWDEMINGGNIEDVMKYAASQGVKLLIWYNSSTGWIEGPGPRFRLNTPKKRQKEYQWLKEKGVAGVKIDFFAGDRVEDINYYIDLLEDAAKYELLVNFHGATIPRGWQRTYPHLMSMEGVYGAEWYNNKPVLTNKAATHNATLPFTRNVVGSMDYTPGTFSDSQHPHITTYGHELALPILFESALQHMPDRPATYYGLSEDVKLFLSELPTAWDDTKLLNGYPGEQVVIARRKGKHWYLAGINGTDMPKTLEIPLSELKTYGKQITLFMDGKTDKEFTIKKKDLTTEKDWTIKIPCLPRGGFAAVIK